MTPTERMLTILRLLDEAPGHELPSQAF